ncbi:MAG: ParB/RepB/Spo0J family partition protein [Acidimicrobiia bacterium]|nr:ParB/RepB/Spo0J family partition protein [Acidimicrobiia bacterium]
MAGRKSGLGRGLEALIPVDHPAAGYAVVQLDSIDPNPQQPRVHFDEAELESLAASIKSVGVLQPVVVRPSGDSYTLVAGERRCRAARLAGLTEIPAVIRESSDDESSLTEALIENVQREGLSPLEEAAAYEQLVAKYSMTHEAVGQAVGKSKSSVSNTIRLLQLPAEIQGMLNDGRIAMGHARALLGLDDSAYALHIAQRAAEDGWSVRQVEDAVRVRSEASPASTPRPGRPRTPRPAAIIELEERLAEHLAATVDIAYAGKAGKVTVKFADIDDLERIYKLLMT